MTYAFNDGSNPTQSADRRDIPTVAVVLFVVVLLLTTIYYIAYFTLRPRVPIFTAESLSLTSLKLSTPAEISATWTVNFTVTNPNKRLRAYYEEMEARIFYDSSSLAVHQLPPFDQATNSQSSVIAKIVAVSAYISPELGRRFEDDWKIGVVKFDVQVLVLVMFGSGFWKCRDVFRALYDDLSVSVSVSSSASNGSFSGGSRRCGVPSAIC